MRNIITISREFGSGGRSIGKEVAKKLGYKYFDKELIEKIAEESGLSTKFIEKNGEYSHSSNIFSYAFVGRIINGMSVEDYLWREQQKVILNLVQKDKCVIVGRCADYILREREDCLNIFIHADMQKKIERVVNLYGETEQNTEKRIMDKDKKRKINYKYYTDRIWGMSQNYHISLDSGVLGLECCEDIIINLARKL